MVWGGVRCQGVVVVVVAGGVTVGMGACMCLYLGIQKLGAAVRAAHSWRLLRKVAAPHRRVYVVTNTEEWQALLPKLYREARQEGAVGLDCEWVQVRGQRRAVAMLQLASCSGTCVLLRLTHMAPHLPHSLAEFLNDESILKVGVGPVEDSIYLTSDYGLTVRGCVDLRHLALLCPGQDGGGGGGGLGLNGLAQRYLGTSLDKDWRVRASDWEANTLTSRQVRYAAEDALVGVQLLVSLTAQLCLGEEWEGRGTSTPSRLLALLLPPPLWYQHLTSLLRHTAQPFIDLKFSSKSHQQQGVPAAPQTPAALKVSQVREAPRRRSKLYHNCQLLAPDDQPLCTLDPKKAWWYVDKGLGILVSEEPLVVRLKFEPAGRPQAESGDGAFYLQSRLNVCVVCGCEDSYIRKSIVPHEYRRHFHRLLKSHQNHDVVLLCFPCHRTSNMADNALRIRLGEEFGAPVSTDPRAKATIDGPRKAARDAARAMLRPPGTIPTHRHANFVSTIQEFYPDQDLTPAMLEEAANMEVKVYREGHVAHGLGVYQAFCKVGIGKLEQRWRQHFLDSMQPRFMPECWSISHNTYKMQLKMTRLPLDHPDRLVYKMALVGTEGTIHVPYDPNVGRKSSSSTSPEPSRDSTPEVNSCPLDLHDEVEETLSHSPPCLPSSEDSDEYDNDVENVTSNKPYHNNAKEASNFNHADKEKSLNTPDPSIDD